MNRSTISSKIIVLIGLINLLFVSSCIYFSWPKYWIHINYENSHLTWFSSIQLILISLTCFSIDYNKTKKNYGRWSIIGLGFSALALDEKFQIHERLREGVFKTNSIGTSLPYIGEGDFAHLIVAAIGILLSFFILKDLRVNKSATIFYFFAVFISLIFTVMDATHIIQDLKTQEALTAFRNAQFTEELLETVAQMFFLWSFTKIRWHYIAKNNE